MYVYIYYRSTSLRLAKRRSVFERSGRETRKSWRISKSPALHAHRVSHNLPLRNRERPCSGQGDTIYKVPRCQLAPGTCLPIVIRMGKRMMFRRPREHDVSYLLRDFPRTNDPAFSHFNFDYGESYNIVVIRAFNDLHREKKSMWIGIPILLPHQINIFVQFSLDITFHAIERGVTTCPS